MPGVWTRSGVWLIAAACVLLCAVVAARAQTSETDSTVTPPSQSPLTPPGPNPVVAAQDSAYAPRYRFTTFGRTPAVEVILDYDLVSGSTTLADLASAVSVIDPTAACTDVTDVPEPTTTPAAG